VNILFVHTKLSTFVKIDLEILRAAHQVWALHFRRQQLHHFIRDFCEALRGILWADVILCWFGSYQAFLTFLPARLCGRKCMVIASGYDVANEPALHYGGLRSGLRRWLGLGAFRLAHQVLAVSAFSAQEAMQNARVPAAKLQVMHHGVDAQVFCPPQDVSTARQGVLTVGIVESVNLSVKGLKLFVETAHHLPEVPFMLVGPWQDGAIATLQALAPPNVHFVGGLFGRDLVQCMATAKVYAQLSAYEAFGMAVAEAMLCGCVPVVSDRGALPEVVGEVGFVVPYGDIAATAQAIRQALRSDVEVRRRCRQRIVEHFSLLARQTQLLRAVQE
jgi:glycosyltransferase involved in cell wall biosynthesis